ncbi:hypothetical protein HYPP_02825 [Hyphomicrobium sp. ghe19]|nr:hypothetical protein HYPP_02825 [Hyphomicrobium sp. ghe19]
MSKLPPRRLQFLEIELTFGQALGLASEVIEPEAAQRTVRGALSGPCFATAVIAFAGMLRRQISWVSALRPVGSPVRMPPSPLPVALPSSLCRRI